MGRTIANAAIAGVVLNKVMTGTKKAASGRKSKGGSGGGSGSGSGGSGGGSGSGSGSGSDNGTGSGDGLNGANGSDGTTSSNSIPAAGVNKVVLSAIFVVAVIGAVGYFLYARLKKEIK